MDSRERDNFLVILQQIADNPELIATDSRVKSLIAKIYKQGRKNQRSKQKQKQATIDNEKKYCLLCHQSFNREHNFYPGICLDCGDLNYCKRFQTVDLSTKTALVTGARIRIGYRIALKLLRSGARVIATTRFPHDAAKRYAREADFARWCDRLHIYGLDLRHITSLEQFLKHILNFYSRLDIIINNAAQTIRHPTHYYRHLIAFESLILAELPIEIRGLVDRHHKFYLEQYRVELQPKSSILLMSSEKDDKNQTNFTALLSQIALIAEDWKNNNILFPLEEYDGERGSRSASIRTTRAPESNSGVASSSNHRVDEDGEQLDLRSFNSWLMKDEDVNPVELLEVHLINAIAPFIINSRLKSLMKQQLELDKYIINVSSAEGRFTDKNKSWRHPHTNMAKAALNQMTRTCAQEYAQYNIFMNAVDPGWISFQQPYPQVAEMKAKGMKLSLDSEDGAARIYDLIYLGESDKEYPIGKLFKNYHEVTW